MDQQHTYVINVEKDSRPENYWRPYWALIDGKRLRRYSTVVSAVRGAERELLKRNNNMWMPQRIDFSAPHSVECSCEFCRLPGVLHDAPPSNL